MSTHTETKTPEIEEPILEKNPENDSEYIESEISSEDVENTSSLFDNEGIDLEDVGSINMSDDEDDYEEPLIDMGGLLTSVLTTEEGETICKVLDLKTVENPENSGTCVFKKTGRPSK